MFEMKSHYRFTFWYGSSYDKNNNLKAIIKTYCDKETEMFLETFNNELSSNFGAWNNYLFLMKQKLLSFQRNYSKFLSQRAAKCDSSSWKFLGYVLLL